jgi:hypothetical protein
MMLAVATEEVVLVMKMKTKKMLVVVDAVLGKEYLGSWTARAPG